VSTGENFEGEHFPQSRSHRQRLWDESKSLALKKLKYERKNFPDPEHGKGAVGEVVRTRKLVMQA
jgi:hypothetical protein